MSEWTLTAIEKPPLTERSNRGMASMPVLVLQDERGIPEVALLIQEQFSNDYLWTRPRYHDSIPPDRFKFWQPIKLPVPKPQSRINAIWYWTNGKVGFGHRNGKARDYWPSAASLGRVARLLLWLRVHRRWLLDVRERNGQLAVYPSENLEYWRLQRQVQKEYWG